MSKTNPYNLPPPWNPGYSMPQNVIDEGLERHGYVTEWAPRGTYDNPKVGSAGYALPGYLDDEPYGGNAIGTRWAPRGSYAGPPVRHWLDHPSALVEAQTKLPGGATRVQIATLAGTEQQVTGGPTPFAAYGLTSAAALIDTVKMMPPDMRKQQLKLAMNKIDPKLWTRAEQGAAAEVKAGAPARVALERGLGAAMSLGISTELVDLGKGKRPAKRSQLGAVCGCGLGDTPAASAVPVPGQCTADGMFIWRGAAGAIPGHWERLKKGEACGTALPPSTATAEVRVHGSAAGFCKDSAGKTVYKPAGQDCPTGTEIVVPASAPAPPVADPADQHFLNIGPFLIPTDVGAWRDHTKLTDDRKAYVDENVAIAAKAGGISVAEMQTGKYPFVKFQTGADWWGLYYQLKSDGSTVVAYHKVATDQLSGLGDVFSDIGGALKDVAEKVVGAVLEILRKVWKVIKEVAAKVVQFVKDAAKWVANAACDLMTSGVGKVAAAAAGAYVGGAAGAQLGAAGAQIAANACSKPVTCPPGQGLGPDRKTCIPVAPPPATSSLLPILLIAGAGLATVALFGGRKKKATP